eukprot:1179491-Prorocentrum_minimum.AAC.4
MPMLRAIVWMLRAIVRMLRATVRMLRATVQMLRATVWMLRAIVWMLRAAVWMLRAIVRMLRATVRMLRATVRMLYPACSQSATARPRRCSANGRCPSRGPPARGGARTWPSPPASASGESPSARRAPSPCGSTCAGQEGGSEGVGRGFIDQV